MRSRSATRGVRFGLALLAICWAFNACADADTASYLPNSAHTKYFDLSWADGVENAGETGRMLDGFVEYFGRTFFPITLPGRLKVFILKDRKQQIAFMRERFGASGKFMGTYRESANALITSEKTGPGTFLHILMLPILSANMPFAPGWARLTVRTFFEKSFGYWQDGRLELTLGFHNSWRLEEVGGDLPTLKISDLVPGHPGGKAGQSEYRLVGMFLWEQGRFERFLQLLHDADRRGYPTYLEAALDMKMADIRPKWRAWTEALYRDRALYADVPVSQVFDTRSAYVAFRAGMDQQRAERATEARARRLWMEKYRQAVDAAQRAWHAENPGWHWPDSPEATVEDVFPVVVATEHFRIHMTPEAKDSGHVIELAEAAARYFERTFFPLDAAAPIDFYVVSDSREWLRLSKLKRSIKDRQRREDFENARLGLLESHSDHLSGILALMLWRALDGASGLARSVAVSYYHDTFAYWQGGEIHVDAGNPDAVEIGSYPGDFGQLALPSLLSEIDRIFDPGAETHLLALFLGREGKFADFVRRVHSGKKDGFASFVEAAIGQPADQIEPRWRAFLADIEANMPRYKAMPWPGLFETRGEYERLDKAGAPDRVADVEKRIKEARARRERYAHTIPNRNR